MYTHIKVKVLSCVQLFQIPWTVACQAPLSMGFSRQEYWSGLPIPSPGIFQTQGSNLGLLHYRQILYHLSHLGNQYVVCVCVCVCIIKLLEAPSLNCFRI